ncbi:MAG: hypothetical protein JW822_03585 [Spirochaetales bacterium]|nr:hypothetical protein [Spirochaetales bacterium]
MTKLMFFIIICISLGSLGFAQDNPFFSEAASEKEERVSSPEVPGFFQSLLYEINNLQRELNTALSELSRQINQKKDFGLFLLLMAIALIYGLIHALGPGHGKIIMISYTLSNPMKPKQGIWLGAFIAVIHTLSAIFLVSILFFLLARTYSDYSQEPKRIISLVSYGLISAMGMFLLMKTIFIDVLQLKKRNDNSNVKVTSKQNCMRDLMMPAFFIGVVPCEGAILVLIFSISINAYWLGIVLALVMSLGMAMTISIMGIATIYSKKGVLKLIAARAGAVKIISSIIQIAGAVVILCFGLLLFCSRLL